MRTDAQLIALIREGHDRAFEVLFNRYQPRLLAFCRRLVGSPQDAEDVLQEVFVAAHAAILADDRPINARPWLYRIARNRCLSHLRKPTADGVDSMDVHPHDNGASTLERVQRREELRAIVSDVHELPETQRTALVLRTIDDLSYADIAQAMNTTLPSVKSLMVRARMSLSQAIQARGALAPVALLALLRKLIPTKLGGSSGAGGTAGAAGSVGSAAGTGSGIAGAKVAVGIATAALFTAGAVSIEMSLDGRNATPGAGGAGVSVPAGTTSEIGSSATSPRAAQRAAAAKSAGASGSRARTGSGSGDAAAGRPPVRQGAAVEAPGGPALGGGDLVPAAGESVLAPATSRVDSASNAVGALLGPAIGRSATPPKARPDLGVVDLPRPRLPGPPDRRPALPKPPLTP